MSNPIRVLQVVTHMNRAGLETMLMNYYRHIDRTKVQFDFLVHRFERAAYDDEIEYLGGIIYRLPRLVPWSPTYLHALDQFFKQHPEYSIVHVHQDCMSSVILKAAERNGIPVRIAHSHSSNQDKNFKYPIKLLYKHSIPKYATTLFACGQIAGRWMFEVDNFQIINNAINCSKYSFDKSRRRLMRTSLLIAEDTLVIGHVGRFSPPKNHDFLLDIFSSLHHQKPDSVLLLVGDGDLRPQIEKKAKDLGLSEHIIFTGVRSDVADLMQAMDVFVLPSLYEGLPVTMVEAQAAGLPCVISDKVPTDCILSDLVTQIPLTASTTHWSETIVNSITLRTDTFDVLCAAGFDIGINSKKLEVFYLDAYHESKKNTADSIYTGV